MAESKLTKLTYFLSLFGSLSTLLCCALPVVLVTVGLGATFASLTSTFPQVIWLAENKLYVFILTGLLLSLSYYLMNRSTITECPIDEGQKDACQSSKGYTKLIFYISFVVYGIGLFFAYILPFSIL